MRRQAGAPARMPCQPPPREPGGHHGHGVEERLRRGARSDAGVYELFHPVSPGHGGVTGPKLSLAPGCVAPSGFTHLEGRQTKGRIHWRRAGRRGYGATVQTRALWRECNKRWGSLSVRVAVQRSRGINARTFDWKAVGMSDLVWLTLARYPPRVLSEGMGNGGMRVVAWRLVAWVLALAWFPAGFHVGSSVAAGEMRWPADVDSWLILGVLALDSRHRAHGGVSVRRSGAACRQGSLSERVELDPVWWTSSERGIRCRPWRTRRAGGRGEASRMTTRRVRYDWSSMRVRRSRPRRTIWA